MAPLPAPSLIVPVSCECLIWQTTLSKIWVILRTQWSGLVQARTAVSIPNLTVRTVHFSVYNYVAWWVEIMHMQHMWSCNSKQDQTIQTSRGCPWHDKPECEALQVRLTSRLAGNSTTWSGTAASPCKRTSKMNDKSMGYYEKWPALKDS